MNNLTIRPLAAGDLPSCKTVIDSTGLFPSELLDEMAAPFLSGAPGDELWFVAADDQRAYGLCYCAPERMTDRVWNLLLIAVDSSRHGQGLGGRLTRTVEAAVAERRGRLLLVETSGLPEFERTRAVYGRLGYSAVARIPDYYAQGEDKVVFCKAVQS